MSQFINDNPLRYFLEFKYPDLIEQARMERLTVRLSHLDGLITFPSYHASAACIFVWATWRVRTLRYSVAALNTLIVISVPNQGSHYLVDVIAGVLLACAGITVVTKFTNDRRSGTPLQRV